MPKNFIRIHYNQSEKVYSESEQINAQELFHKKIWRVGDVAKFLDCTVGHVYNLASDEKIPKRKKHGFLFFVPEEILNWILEGDLK
jgi:predicted DNA-binding transcriptional regulator AlpA